MSIVTRLKSWAANNLAFIFSLLRFFKPNLVLKEFALITRFKDVQEALSRPDVLDVTYAEKMSVITAGGSFFLGMSNTAIYTRDVSNMRIAVRRTDIEQIVAPMVEKFARDIVANSNGKMDIVPELTISALPA